MKIAKIAKNMLCIFLLMMLMVTVVPTDAALAAKQYVTGKAVCKKGSSVLFTDSAKICTTGNHAGCTAAKTQAVTNISAECKKQGGIPSQSGDSCTYGAKC